MLASIVHHVVAAARCRSARVFLLSFVRSTFGCGLRYRSSPPGNTRLAYVVVATIIQTQPINIMICGLQRAAAATPCRARQTTPHAAPMRAHTCTACGSLRLCQPSSSTFLICRASRRRITHAVPAEAGGLDGSLARTGLGGGLLQRLEDLRDQRRRVTVTVTGMVNYSEDLEQHGLAVRYNTGDAAAPVVTGTIPVAHVLGLLGPNASSVRVLRDSGLQAVSTSTCPS
jgi:hypothetical protein